MRRPHDTLERVLRQSRTLGISPTSDAKAGISVRHLWVHPRPGSKRDEPDVALRENERRHALVTKSQ